MFTEVEITMIRNASPQECLKLLYKKIGSKGFEDSKKLNGYISDLIVDTTLKQRLYYAVNSNIHFYILKEPTCLIETTRLRQIIQLVKNQTGMSESSAKEIIYLFAYATGRIEIYDENKIYFKSLHPVKINGKYGYANENNELVIKSKYDSVKPFVNDRAKVCLKGYYGFIDRSGDEIIPIIYEKAYDFYDDHTKVVLNGNVITIDKEGKIL